MDSAPPSSPQASPVAPPSAIPAAAKWAAISALTLAGIAIAGWSLANPRPALHLDRRDPPTAVAPQDPAPKPAQPSAVAPAPVASAATGIGINSATQAQLELLPGVGPALAQRIIADRERNGRYTSIEQLDRVKGIGPKTIEKLRPHIRID